MEREETKPNDADSVADFESDSDSESESETEQLKQTRTRNRNRNECAYCSSQCECVNVFCVSVCLTVWQSVWSVQNVAIDLPWA